MIYISLSIAMVALATMVIKIPSIRGGYVNFGDIIIFMTAVLIGKKAGFLAGGIGSAMADIILGYTSYAPGTFLIKGIEGFICGWLAGDRNKQNSHQLMLSMILSAAWMVFGYFMYEYQIGALLFANEDFGITAAVMNLPGNIIQGSVSAAAALSLVMALKKVRIHVN